MCFMQSDVRRPSLEHASCRRACSGLHHHYDVSTLNYERTDWVLHTQYYLVICFTSTAGPQPVLSSSHSFAQSSRQWQHRTVWEEEEDRHGLFWRTCYCFYYLQTTFHLRCVVQQLTWTIFSAWKRCRGCRDRAAGSSSPTCRRCSRTIQSTQMPCATVSIGSWSACWRENASCVAVRPTLWTEWNERPATSELRPGLRSDVPRRLCPPPCICTTRPMQYRSSLRWQASSLPLLSTT